MPSGACGAKSPGHSCTTASCVCCRPPGPRDVTPPLGTPHESGRRAEELAADFLRSQGFEILERNYRRRLGELDIIAERAGVLVIAEVRTRSSTAFGGAAAQLRPAVILIDHWMRFAAKPLIATAKALTRALRCDS